MLKFFYLNTRPHTGSSYSIPPSPDQSPPRPGWLFVAGFDEPLADFVADDAEILFDNEAAAAGLAAKGF